MRNWLWATWDQVRTSLWFIPSIMFVAGVVLALGMRWIDQGLGEDQVRSWWINTGNGEDARNLLSTLLAATIGMASMAFSVTVVALSLAAGAYGPRLIRIFRADLRTQLALGMFVMVIVYCLIVLRTVRGEAPMSEVPHAAVTVGTGLALLAVLGLLGFIQGVAKLLAADEVVRRVRLELDSAVSDLSSADEAETTPAVSDDLLRELEQNGTRIRLPREGYVQAVDYEAMAEWAEQNGCVLQLDFTAGDFVVEGDHRVLVHPPPRDEVEARARIDKFIISGDERTPMQDLEFAMRHLVEVALRALSPGINDPFTAKAVIDRLRGALSRLMGRRLPAAAVADKGGHVRIIRPATSHGRLVDAAFHQIRQASSERPAVLIHMLGAITGIAEHARTEEQREALRRHARLIRDAAARDVPEPEDRADVEANFVHAMQALAAKKIPKRHGHEGPSVGRPEQVQRR